MADIELVIKIPEELKNKIDNANEDNYRTPLWWFETTLYCAIKDGTPLPKGHDRLVDMKNLQNFVSQYTEHDAVQLILADREDYIPTLIEADKESEDTE